MTKGRHSQRDYIHVKTRFGSDGFLSAGWSLYIGHVPANRRNQTLVTSRSRMYCISSSSCFGCIVLKSYRDFNFFGQCYLSKTDHLCNTVFQCPMYFQCKCVCKWQVTDERVVTVLVRFGIHTLKSHIEDQSKCLKRGQIDVIKDMVRCNPFVVPSTVRKNLKSFTK